MRRRLAIAVLAAFLAGYVVGQADAAAPRGAVQLPSSLDPVIVPAPETAGPLPGAPLSLRYPIRRAVRESAVGWHPYPDPVPSGAPPDPGTTAPPPETWTREGIASWMPERFGPTYLALPIGPGHRVELCGAGGCEVMVSNDAGPALVMQRANRIADIAVLAWERICAVPRSLGLCPVTWTLVP